MVLLGGSEQIRIRQIVYGPGEANHELPDLTPPCLTW